MRFINSRNASIILGISACSMMGYFLYLLLKNEDDDSIDVRPITSKFKVIEMKVPKNTVRSIIGRNGQTIKNIQAETNTRLNFKDTVESDYEFRTLVIRGAADACYLAQNYVHELIANQPKLESFNMWVPQTSIGKIIGRCGENITEISSTSGAKITITDERNEALKKCIIVKGTKDQINIAKTLIEDVIQRCTMTKSLIDSSLAKREPRLPPKTLDITKSGKPKVEDITSPGQTESQFEVYVSAMIDPSCFWLQIVGPKATELDQLVEEMSEYYNKEENRDAHKLNSVQKGDLVAAIFQYDDKWYRAEVLNVIANNSDEPQAELYYVDYGDTDQLPCKNLYELRTDFLRLHFQAIECYLAKIEPVGDTWTEQAIDKFEEWTHVAQWKKLSAKVNGYCVREKTRAKREGSPVPGVELFDVNNQQDVDIAQELVDHGFALFKKENELHTGSSRTTSNSSVNSIS